MTCIDIYIYIYIYMYYIHIFISIYGVDEGPGMHRLLSSRAWTPSVAFRLASPQRRRLCRLRHEVFRV